MLSAAAKEHGASLLAWMETWLEQAGAGFGEQADDIVWLSGEASTALALKRRLISGGVSPEQVFSKAYWSVKGHAHRKTNQRSL